MPVATETISRRQARRLALTCAGLLRPEWIDLDLVGRGRGPTAFRSAHAVIRHFGYLQLDTVSIAGARSHGLVLLSRLPHLDPRVGEDLLTADAPLFEYWGHEACWMPIELYSWFEFRRVGFRSHPWWGDLVGAHPKIAKSVLDRIEAEGPLRSADFEGERKGSGWWNHSLVKKIATALWSSGELAIRERRHFHRTFDLAERVIPRAQLETRVTEDDAVRKLLRRALDGHGWATQSTLAATWRLRRRRKQVATALEELRDAGEIVSTELVLDDGKTVRGWCRPAHLELAARLERCRPRRDRGVLLSPFDPVLWDRARVEQLFDFEQVLEIYKPAPTRVYGYYCLPVLAGDGLVGRVDLKADRTEGKLRVLSRHFGPRAPSRTPSSEIRRAVAHAIERHADRLDLRVTTAGGGRSRPRS